MKKFLAIAAVCSLALAAACSQADIAGNSANSNIIAASNAAKPAQTAKPNPAEAVKFSVEKATEIAAGKSGAAILQLRIAAPFHVNSNPPSEKNYIPLEIKFDNQNGVSAKNPIYPKGTLKKFAFSENQPLSVYDGAITVKLPLEAAKTAVKGAQTLNGKLSFQACDDEVCYRPQTVSVELPVVVN